MSERPSRTRILILAASALQRAALTALLDPQPALHIVGSAGDATEAAPRAAATLADTILVDVSGPDPAAMRQLAQHLSRGALLCLVDDASVPRLVDLVRSGVMGCLVRDATVDELGRAIVAVGRGELVLPPAAATAVLVALARGGATAVTPEPALTERESQVVELLASGQTNKEIAQALFLSVRTVEAHLRNIFGKLDVSSRTEAALWAVRHGFAPD